MHLFVALGVQCNAVQFRRVQISSVRFGSDWFGWVELSWTKLIMGAACLFSTNRGYNFPMGEHHIRALIYMCAWVCVCVKMKMKWYKWNESMWCALRNDVIRIIFSIFQCIFTMGIRTKICCFTTVNANDYDIAHKIHRRQTGVLLYFFYARAHTKRIPQFIQQIVISIHFFLLLHKGGF